MKPDGSSPRVLIACIGNIFEGDDAFGPEVAKHLIHQLHSDEVQIEDFGIRSYDLAYALTRDYEFIVLVDATTRGNPPGTLYLLELGVSELDDLEPREVDPHRLNPVGVLQMARNLGGIKGKIYLVGCEPAVLENENGFLGLSEPAQEAVPRALEMIQAFIRDALGRETETRDGLVPI